MIILKGADYRKLSKTQNRDSDFWSHAVRPGGNYPPEESFLHAKLPESTLFLSHTNQPKRTKAEIPKGACFSNWVGELHSIGLLPLLPIRYMVWLLHENKITWARLEKLDRHFKRPNRGSPIFNALFTDSERHPLWSQKQANSDEHQKFLEKTKDQNWVTLWDSSTYTVNMWI